MNTQHSSSLADLDAQTQGSENEFNHPSVLQQDGWLLSFIDILTLLLTLFVLLLAYKHDGVESNDIGPVMETSPLNHVQTAILPMLTSPLLPNLRLTEPDTNYLEIEQPPVMLSAIESAPVLAQTTSEAISETTDNTSNPRGQISVESQTVASLEIDKEDNDQTLQKQLTNTTLNKHFNIITEGNAVVVELRDELLFRPASTDFSSTGDQLLIQLAGEIKNLPYAISVEGHTDNIPINTAQFPSNWDLSASRAITVTKELIKLGVSSKHIHAAGFGDTRPKYDNTTAEGRAKNRRVSFILKPVDPDF